MGGIAWLCTTPSPRLTGLGGCPCLCRAGAIEVPRVVLRPNSRLTVLAAGLASTLWPSPVTIGRG